MRPERYNFRESERKWQKIWSDGDVFGTPGADPRHLEPHWPATR